MRRIVPKAEEERKRKRNNIFVGVIAIVIMIGSVFGVVIGYSGSPAGNPETTEVEYNGQTFQTRQGYWFTQYRGLNLTLRYSPEETGNNVNIENSLNPLGSYQGSPLYIYSEDSIARSEIARNVGQVAFRMQQVCLNEENCENNYPIKDCSQNTIIVKQGPENKINQTKNCVYIEGSQNELSRIADEFVYRISGLK